jgi:RNA polymerase sigma-70 factor (ECF subfamily)
VTTSTQEDFGRRTEVFRRELLAHCYRMLGSVHDAEDLLQETMLRAWRSYDRYDPERASLRTWLYRIATNACLTALEQRSRRPLPSGLGPSSDDPAQPQRLGEGVPWLQPIPDRMLGDPADLLLSRNSLRLAIVAAMQLLPARQRAVLLLRDVVGWPATEVAAALGMTPAAANSALQRARARLSKAGLREDQVGEPDNPRDRARVERYAVAFETADLATLRQLLTEDAVLEMPPQLNWYAGRDACVGYITRVYARLGTDWQTRLVGANGQLAFAAYVRRSDAVYALNTLQVLTLSSTGISRATVFQDDDVLRLFDLPPTYPADNRDDVARRQQLFNS